MPGCCTGFGYSSRNVSVNPADCIAVLTGSGKALRRLYTRVVSTVQSRCDGQFQSPPTSNGMSASN